MPSVRPRKPTVRFQRLCSFFFSFFTHTPSRKSSPQGRRRDPLRECTRQRRVAAAVQRQDRPQAAGCSRHSRQKNTCSCSWLLFSMLMRMHILSFCILQCTSGIFFCAFSAPLPLYLLIFFHRVSKITLPDSLCSSSRLGGRHRKGAQENKNVNH